MRGPLPSQAMIPPYRTYMKECTVREFERYGRTSPQVDPARTVAEEVPLLAGRPASCGFAPQRFRLRHIRGATDAATDAPSRNEDDLAKQGGIHKDYLHPPINEFVLGFRLHGHM